jgi:hypothetical protein
MKLRKLSFPIEKTFSPSDPLAIDILRLMAGYNDMALFIEWLEEHLKEPEEFDEKNLGSWATRSATAFTIRYDARNAQRPGRNTETAGLSQTRKRS